MAWSNDGSRSNFADGIRWNYILSSGFSINETQACESDPSKSFMKIDYHKPFSKVREGFGRTLGCWTAPSCRSFSQHPMF